jgi:hypothetical protein
MIMSSITSYENARHFLPKLSRKATPTRLLATLRTIAEGMRDGLAAERHYRALIVRGVPHARAAAQVFREHFVTR